MDKEAQEAPEKDQKQPLVGNRLLEVTVTALFFRKWWIDYVSPYNERMFFLDGISLDGIGTPFFVRAWWEIPLDDLALFEELGKVPMNSFLTMSTKYCTVESGKDFQLDEVPASEDSPQVALVMKAPEIIGVVPEERGDSLKAPLLEAKKAHVPGGVVYD